MRKYFLIPFWILNVILASFPLVILIENNFLTREQKERMWNISDVIGLVLMIIMSLLLVLWLIKRDKTIKLREAITDIPKWQFIAAWICFALFVFGMIIDTEPTPPISNLFDIVLTVFVYIYVLFLFGFMMMPFIKEYVRKSNNVCQNISLNQETRGKRYYLIPATFVIINVFIILIIFPLLQLDIITANNTTRLINVIILSVICLLALVTIIMFFKWADYEDYGNVENALPKSFSYIATILYFLLGINLLILAINYDAGGLGQVYWWFIAVVIIFSSFVSFLTKLGIIKIKEDKKDQEVVTVELDVEEKE